MHTSTDVNLDKLADPGLRWIDNAWNGTFKDKQKDMLIKEL